MRRLVPSPLAPCFRRRTRGCNTTHTYTHTPPLLWIRCLHMLFNLCLRVCSVIRDLSSTPSCCTCAYIHVLKVTHSLTSLPTHTTAATLNHVLIAHVISMLARLRSHRLCRRCVRSWMDRRLYGTEIQDCFCLPLVL